jgi:hypothetical protein
VIRTNSLLRREGLWRIVRRPVAPTPPIRGFAVGCRCDDFEQSTYPNLEVESISPEQLPSAVNDLPPDALVAIVQEDFRILSADWPWEALGLFELFDDLAVVVGRLLNSSGRVSSAGEVLGMGEVCGSPCRGWPAASPRRHGMLLCQRTVSAGGGAFFVARAGFLATAISEARLRADILPLATKAKAFLPTLLGAWLGAAARRRGLRIAYSPHIVAQRLEDRTRRRCDEETWQFLESHWRLLLDDPYYSPVCSLREGHGWQLTSRKERATVLNQTLSALAGPHPFSSQIKLRTEVHSS